MNVLQTVPLMYVADIEASQSFYCDQLGLEIAQSFAPDGNLGWCWLRLEGASLMLQQQVMLLGLLERLARITFDWYVIPDARQNRNVSFRRPAEAG